jgi:hypothetical protein
VSRINRNGISESGWTSSSQSEASSVSRSVARSTSSRSSGISDVLDTFSQGSNASNRSNRSNRSNSSWAVTPNPPPSTRSSTRRSSETTASALSHRSYVSARSNASSYASATSNPSSLGLGTHRDDVSGTGRPPSLASSGGRTSTGQQAADALMRVHDIAQSTRSMRSSNMGRYLPQETLSRYEAVSQRSSDMVSELNAMRWPQISRFLRTDGEARDRFVRDVDSLAAEHDRLNPEVQDAASVADTIEHAPLTFAHWPRGR